MSERKLYKVYLFWSGYAPSSGDIHERMLNPDQAESFCRRLAARATHVNKRSYDCHAVAI